MNGLLKNEEVRCDVVVEVVKFLLVVKPSQVENGFCP